MRSLYPGGDVYHALNRAVGRSTIFEKAGDYTAFYLCWLTNAHTRRWHLAHRTVGTGPLYQGRFKSFPVQEDGPFFTVCRYVERNALRANLVAAAQQWRWSSLGHRVHKSQAVTLASWPLGPGPQWLEDVTVSHE